MSSYHNEPYKLNPKIKEMIEKKRGKITLSYNQIELMLADILRGKSTSYVFNDEDKVKIKSYIDDFNPNSYSESEIINMSNFMTKILEEKEIVEYLISATNKFYNPGRVYANYRVSNTKITHLLSQFPKYFNLYKGIIININFIGDVKKVYPEVIFDENTGNITDENVKTEISNLIDFVITKFGDKIKYSIKDNIVVIATNSENTDVIDYLNQYKLKIEDIPDFYFKWEENE